MPLPQLKAHRPTAADELTAFDAEKMQQAVASWIDAFKKACPIADGVLVEGLEMTAGVERAINHGLGRKYRGYIVTSQSDDATFDEQRNSDTRATNVRLAASANCTIDLWVF